MNGFSSVPVETGCSKRWLGSARSMSRKGLASGSARRMPVSGGSSGGSSPASAGTVGACGGAAGAMGLPFSSTGLESGVFFSSCWLEKSGSYGVEKPLARTRAGAHKEWRARNSPARRSDRCRLFVVVTGTTAPSARRLQREEYNGGLRCRQVLDMNGILSGKWGPEGDDIGKSEVQEDS
jgi:hypothetical protein